MKLTGVIEYNDELDDFIWYGLDPGTAIHEVEIWRDGSCEAYHSSTPGHIISALAPFRDIEDVRALVAWLSR